MNDKMFAFQFGRIDKAGKLFVSRKSGDSVKETAQYCKNNENRQCGDWCPLFREPDRYWLSAREKDEDKEFCIRICENSHLVFVELEDQR